MFRGEHHAERDDYFDTPAGAPRLYKNRRLEIGDRRLMFRGDHHAERDGYFDTPAGAPRLYKIGGWESERGCRLQGTGYSSGRGKNA